MTPSVNERLGQLRACQRLFVQPEKVVAIHPASPQDVYNAVESGKGTLYVVTRQGSESVDSRYQWTANHQAGNQASHRLRIDYTAMPLWDVQLVSLLPLADSQGRPLEGVCASSLSPWGGSITTEDYQFSGSGGGPSR